MSVGIDYEELWDIVDRRIASSLERILEEWGPYEGQDVFRYVLPNLEKAIREEIGWLRR